MYAVNVGGFTLQTVDRIAFLKNFDQIAANLDAPVGITGAQGVLAIALSPTIYSGLLELHERFKRYLPEDQLLSTLDAKEHSTVLAFKRDSAETLRCMSPEKGCHILVSEEEAVVVLIHPQPYEILASYLVQLRDRGLLKELLGEVLKGRELWATFQLRREDKLGDH